MLFPARQHELAANSSVMQKGKFQIKRKVLKREVWGPFGVARSIWGCQVQLCPTMQSNEMVQMEESVDYFFFANFHVFFKIFDACVFIL